MGKKYFVYVLYNAQTNRLYVGFTSDIGRRLQEHSSARMSHRNKSFNPVLIETYYNKEDALKRERYFKSSKGKYTLRTMLQNTIESM